MMESYCIKCKRRFDAESNRVYNLVRQKINPKIRSITLLSQGLREFINYQIVKCPFCGKTFKEDRLRVFRFFTPKQVLIFIFTVNIMFVIYATILVIRLIIRNY